MNSVELAQNYGDDVWRKDAACRDSDPDLFFPVGTTGLAVEQIENAKAVCAECDVQVDCLDFALRTKQEYGVWGGTTEDERRKIRRNSKTYGSVGDVAIQSS